MAYLISHIAIGLLCTMMMGLLLGWLLWGYSAKERGRELLVLRERIADMQMMSARLAVSSGTRMALPDLPNAMPNRLMEEDLPERAPAHRAFFEDEEINEEEAFPPLEAPSNRDPFTKSAPVESRSAYEARMAFESKIAPVAPDLEAEVREAKIQHLQQQVKELESVRDRLPLLQADLSDALAGRKSAEARYQEAKNDFEVRSSSLLSQIRDFENAAAEWDETRDRLEHERIATEKELEGVKATLRDLQNSQRPQAVETLSAVPSASAVELADLRERYQRALRERDSIASELEFWKQSDGDQQHDSPRVAELEAQLRGKEEQLGEQAARVESLLWRVAELEPFAAEAPKKEEDLRRQESEIAGHMEMHSENAERIRSLQNHIAELQMTMIPSEELQRILTEHQGEVQQLKQTHEQLVGELQQALAMKDDEITEHVSARYGQVNLVNNMQARIDELEAASQRVKTLEKLLMDRDTEIRGLLAAHAEMQREMQTWQAMAEELQPVAAEVPGLQSTLNGMQTALKEHEDEIRRLKELHTDKDGQLTFLHERLGAMSSRLAAHQQRLQEIEPLAVKTPELEKKLVETEQESRERLQALADRHHDELSRLKVNSAQRIRRLRQGITGFKG